MPPESFWWNDIIKKVTFPSSMREILDNAFKGCANLSAAVLNNGLESIGEDAFSACPQITHLDIPESVTALGSVPSAWSIMKKPSIILRLRALPATLFQIRGTRLLRKERHTVHLPHSLLKAGGRC